MKFRFILFWELESSLLKWFITILLLLILPPKTQSSLTLNWFKKKNYSNLRFNSYIFGLKLYPRPIFFLQLAFFLYLQFIFKNPRYFGLNDLRSVKQFFRRRCRYFFRRFFLLSHIRLAMLEIPLDYLLDIFLSVSRTIATQQNYDNRSVLILFMLVVDGAVRVHEGILTPISANWRIWDEFVEYAFTFDYCHCFC